MNTDKSIKVRDKVKVAKKPTVVSGSSESVKFDFLYGAEKYPRYNYEQALLGFVKERHIFGGNVNNFLGVWDKDDLNCWIARKEVERDCFEEGKKLLKSDFFEGYMQESAAFRKQCKTFHQKMWLTSHAERSDNELLKLLDEMGDNIRLALVYFRGSRPEYTKPVEQELQQLLQEKTEEEQQLSNWLMVLVTPEEVDDIKEEQLTWDSLVIKVRQDSKFDTQQVLLDHLFQYSWLYPEQLNLEKPLVELRKRLDSDSRSVGKIERDIQAMRDKQDRFSRERHALLHELDNDRIAYLAGVLSRSTLERMEVKACWSGMTTVCHTLWHELAKRTGESPELLMRYYFEKDIKQALLKHKRLAGDEIKRRKDFSMAYINFPEFIVEHGPTARVKARKILAETLKELDTDELSGQIASPGKAKGVARLVAFDVEGQREAAKSFKEGDILVTKMTQPNMIPIARLASAIVTDEGGITSHAAVISREFKIPCVVGTKLATKVIKDGDEIEVDADKSIVRLIKEKAYEHGEGTKIHAAA